MNGSEATPDKLVAGVAVPVPDDGAGWRHERPARSGRADRWRWLLEVPLFVLLAVLLAGLVVGSGRLAALLDMPCSSDGVTVLHFSGGAHRPVGGAAVVRIRVQRHGVTAPSLAVQLCRARGGRDRGAGRHPSR